MAGRCVPTDMPLVERIMQHSMPVPECGCWLWLKSTVKGYGQLTFQKKHLETHRASWIAFRGPIPSGMHVLHRCNTRACVNPDHLYLGTNLDNARDRVAAGTARNKPMFGSDHPLAKMNEELAWQIKNAEGTGKQISERFGVKLPTVQAIRSGRQWKHV